MEAFAFASLSPDRIHTSGSDDDSPVPDHSVTSHSTSPELCASSGASWNSTDPLPRVVSTTTGGDRRQKRLERNRESARLSRRRRKHYLEVLEERVTQLGHEMDQGRRDHVKEAFRVILQKLVEQPLLRSSQELQVVATFHAQQLRSFCLPPSTKYILWLTLQCDSYFRGGRAASERLSAARIGERVRNGLK